MNVIGWVLQIRWKMMWLGICGSLTAFTGGWHLSTSGSSFNVFEQQNLHQTCKQNRLQKPCIQLATSTSDGLGWISRSFIKDNKESSSIWHRFPRKKGHLLDSRAIPGVWGGPGFILNDIECSHSLHCFNWFQEKSAGKPWTMILSPT